MLVDCNVKGSDNGTTSDPKFAVRTLWEAIILPAYDALTAPGGPAEGAVVATRRKTHRHTKKVIFMPDLLLNSTKEDGDSNYRPLKAHCTYPIHVTDPYPY